MVVNDAGATQFDLRTRDQWPCSGARGGAVERGGQRAEKFGRARVEIAEGCGATVRGIGLATYVIDGRVIAGVNGRAVGVGCQLAKTGVAWDLAELLVNVGRSPSDAGSQCVLRCSLLTASGGTSIRQLFRGFAAGFGAENSPSGDGPRVVETARGRKRSPPGAVRATKRLLREAEGMIMRDFVLMASVRQALIDYPEAGSCLMEDSVDRLVGE